MGVEEQKMLEKGPGNREKAKSLPKLASASPGKVECGLKYPYKP